MVVMAQEYQPGLGTAPYPLLQWGEEMPLCLGNATLLPQYWQKGQAVLMTLLDAISPAREEELRFQQVSEKPQRVKTPLEHGNDRAPPPTHLSLS